QIIHSDPSVAVLEDGKLIGDVDMEIISYQSEAEIRKKLDEVGDINEIIVTKLLEDIRPAIKGIKTRRDIQSVRVNLDRLDSVIDLLGELVITRGRFQSLISRVTPEMSEQFQIFDNTINSIQDTVMNLRMVNLSQIFDTFPRAVRDIAKTRGLEIDLLLQGTHILLDRSVVDQVHEALLHLVRNAAIHGIENLDGRKSANKSSTGRIRLSAKRERGEVVFEVEDDGAGLNIERIREQGIKQKLISENTPLTRSQVASLIFRPGFSTATEVTEIAGRGVGMDIVKATIDEISGSIEVRTILGKGTKFIIRVPQTLAIIDALIVKAAKNSNQLFAIPLLNVERIFNLRDNVIKKQAEGNYIDWEGRVIRILNLEQILATHGLLNEFIPEEEVIPSRRKTKSSFQDKIILWEKADKRVGLRVSQIIEQREIVTKSLDEISEDIQGFSGATILGYDQVALIIDPDRLDQYNIS
ncbi:MAG: chemotaxis protein CheW, partial [Candidatus Heimdallarchaeota archaeon]|nr:chemotaxis protein CheW [Candidatus Heimdallarchaeota archaeon]